MRFNSYYEVAPDEWRGTDESGIIRSNQEKVESGQSEEPEEFVRQWIWNELIESYDIPESQIKPEVEVKVKEREKARRADLVVYRDDESTLPFIVVETKPPGEKGAPKEAEWYASVLRATYAVGTNGDLTSTEVSILEGKSPERSTSLTDLPVWTETTEPKVTELQPFSSREEISGVFRECHNIIRDNDGLDPIKAFEEMSKLLLAKYADEKTTGRSDEYAFQRLRKVEPGGEVEEEDSNETAQRVRQLFDRFIDDFIADDEGVFDEAEGIDLSNTSITAIVDKLSTYSILTTNVDLKGRAFETFVRTSTRGHLGIYLTPSDVVKSVISMLEPTESSKIIDPSCGTGSFLLEAMRQGDEWIQTEYSDNLPDAEIDRKEWEFKQDNIWGIDINPRLARTTKLNMLLHDDGRGHIYPANALQSFESLPSGVKENQFELVASNPPFGSYVTSDSTFFDDYTTAHTVDGDLRDKQSTEVMFIERGLQLLKPGGTMAIVLPDSVLTNTVEQSVKPLLDEMAEVKAIISLPPSTFAPSGGSNKTSVLILEKVQNPRNTYPVLLSVVKYVGYDTANRQIDENELPELPSIIRPFIKNGERPDPEKDRLGFVKEYSEMGENLTPDYHLPGSDDEEHETSTLEELCEIFYGKSPKREDYLTEPGIPVVKKTNLTGGGIDWRTKAQGKRQFCSDYFFKENYDRHLQEGDIIFVKDSHDPDSLRRGLKEVDIVDWIPEQFGGRALPGGSLMVLRPDKEKIDPYYLLLYLRSEPGRDSLMQQRKGQSAHLYKGDIGDVEVPLPSEDEQEIIKGAIQQVRKEQSNWRDYMSVVGSANSTFPFE